MPESKKSPLDTIFGTLLASIAFLVPIFFLPITSEFFQFNKLALITIVTMIMMVVWAVKMLVEKKVEIVKSPIGLPLFLILAVTAVSSMFSLNKTASIYGLSGRWFPSLSALIILTLFYFAAASNTEKKQVVKNSIIAFIAGATISSIAAVFSYFGLSLGSAPYLQISNFTLTGSPTAASIIAALAVVLAINRILHSPALPIKTALLPTLITNLLAVFLIGRFPSWSILIMGVLFLVYSTPLQKVRENKLHLMGVFGITLALSLVLLIPASRSLIINKNYPIEPLLPPRESWLIASSIVREYPILGTGPSTFNLNYTRYKPLSVNGLSIWNTSISVPYSEAFSIIGSLGLLGVVIFIFFCFRALRFLVNTKADQDNEGLTAASAAAAFSLVLVHLFTPASVTTGFLTFMFLALAATMARLNKTGGPVSLTRFSFGSAGQASGMSILEGAASESREVMQYAVAILLLGSVISGGYLMSKVYTAEYYTRKAFNALANNDGNKTLQMQAKAMTAFPTRDSYHTFYASTSLAIANSIAKRPNLTNDERSAVQALIAQAIRSSRVATEVLNPLNSTGWEIRANIYKTLIGAADNAQQWTTQSYNNAIQLDPASPLLRLGLGGVYYSQEDYLSAATLFNQAVSLKPDYANAHYNLAHALQKLERYTDAQREFLTAQRLIPQDSSDYERVTKDLEALKALPAVAGAETKPTVEEIEGTGAAGTEQTAPATPQEPLTKVGEEEVLEGGAGLESTK